MRLHGSTIHWCPRTGSAAHFLPQIKWRDFWQVVYVGDGNNIVHSWIRLAAKFNFEFVCACPKGFEPDAATIELANSAGAGRVSVSYDPMEVQTCLLFLAKWAQMLQFA
jgi:ornithine carbamoyltransferase